MNASDLFLHRRVVPGSTDGLVRRAMDLAVATMAAAMLAPLMLLIAVVLLLEGGWPVLFVQTRVGIGAKVFQIYKFRKFDVECSPNGLPLTLAGDCRMTRIGRLLAATKFDELPQLWNVLKGDMAIIGPRPESLEFADCFRNGLEAILRYKPGLLGPSQVLFRHEACFFPRSTDPIRFYREVLFPAKARIDLAYYPQRTIGSDISWMWRGFLAVLRQAHTPVNM
jgi:lipopolysaccharide/colanic/teichoic acid biosynthesis glycosyltransferase